MTRDRRPFLWTWIRQAVRDRPLLEPAPSARPKRAAEVRIRVQQIARSARARRGVRLVLETREHREIVLGVVDRLFGPLRGGPSETGLASFLRVASKLVESGKRSGRGAHGF